MSPARKQLQEALQLDDAQRAALALELMGSLTLPDARDELAWLAEIERRARQVLSCASSVLDMDEAVDSLSRDLAL